MELVIALVFFIGFFCESIFGFGGLLISLSILGFFIDIKEIIPVAIYVGIVASSFVLVTDYKSIDWPLMLKRVFPFAAIGTVLGVAIFSHLDSTVLLKIFALFLLFISLKSICLHKSNILKYVKHPLLIGGGVMQGIYGIGGPFTLLAIKDDFKNKSYLRSSMATYFIIFNLVRIIQFKATGVMQVKEVFAMWWLFIPIAAAIFLGYKIHVKLPEKYFKNTLNFLLLFAGIIYLLR